MTGAARRMELPLFPLHAVLFPGVALPLHIFEERYRSMVGRCIAAGEPFGVVLIRDGREVGDAPVSLAQVGTTAIIRQAGRYPDGRMDIVTVGGRRFRIDELHEDREPYLVGEVEILDEPIGEREEARRLARRVGSSFMRYLDRLAPTLGSSGRPEIELEVDLDDDDDADDDDETEASPLIQALEIVSSEELEPMASGTLDRAELDDRQRHRLLMAAAKRLTSTSDPTVLSYVLTGLVQVEQDRRQNLLEAPDTVSRLLGLEQILRREIGLLSRHLKPLVVDASATALRRN
jgi:Lon protease-like protein